MTVFHTFKELDEQFRKPKGTAFRLFKSLLPEFQEGEDFVVLDAQNDRLRIDTLMSSQRVYRQSRNVVLLHEDCYQRLCTLFREQSD